MIPKDLVDLDADGDGYWICEDCDDTRSEVNPGAAEICNDGIDNDCDESTPDQCCTDNDGDGYSQEGGSCGPVDCNDNEALINPGAAEICNDGIDNDCDESTPDQCCTDNDGDGYSQEGGSCGPVDCNDNEALINPGAAEICGDGIDNNCDGRNDEDCCPTIQSVDLVPVVLDASGNGNITFADQIEGNYDSLVWTANGRDFNGTGRLGTEFKEGGNSVTLTVKKEGCADQTYSVQVNIVQRDDCKYIVSLASSANLASGELTDSFELFSANGMEFKVFYRCLDGNTGPLGLNWSHNYNIYLVEDDLGSVAVRDGSGNWKLYASGDSGYSSQPGDYTELSKEASGLFVLTKPNGTIYTFGSNNKIATIVERNGNTLTFIYTGDDLTEIVDNNDHAIQLDTSAGILSSVTDPGGNVYTFSVGDTLDSIVYPDGSLWRFDYQGNAYMTSKTDPVGNLTSYIYDEKNRVIEAVDPEGRSRSIEYPEEEDEERTTTFIEKDGSTRLYTYNVTSGDLVSKTDPQGNVTAYTHDSNHNLIAKSEPGVGTSYYSYDSGGNMVSNTDVAGHTTTNTYNNYGQITSVTNTLDETTVYEYDTQGNLIEITDPQGQSRTYQYDDQNHMIGTTSATGETTSFVYDAQGNVTSGTGPDGQTTTFTYDDNGKRLSMTDARGHTTRYEYDTRGQLIKVIDADGNTTTYQYDANGNRISTTDAGGKTTTFTYNFEGQMTTMTDAMGYVTQFEYGGSAGCPTCSGGVNKLTALTDAKEQTTRFKYDTLGHLIKETDPLGNMTTYNYDIAGRISSKTDPNGNTILYSYNTQGRLIAKDYPDGTQTTYSYDAKGNLLSTANQYIAYNFVYDTTNRLVEVEDSYGHILNYTYNASGNRTTLNSSEDIDIAYQYDEAGRLAAIQSNSTTFTFGYDNLGRRKQLNYPNGITTTYSYDDLGRLTDLITATSSSIIAENHYHHDAVGNRLSNQNTQHTASYAYDDIYRLTEAESNTPGNSSDKSRGSKSPNATENQKEFYQYDPVGNRTASSEHSSYQHNSGNQLLTTNKATYQYDANGNRTGKTTDEGITTYVWDYENRLIQVTTPESNVTYAYDPFGRRIAKTVDSITTRYTYDIEDILFETNNGTVGNIYIHGTGIDEPLALVGKKGAIYYHADGLGSIVAMTDARQKVVQSYEYDSYGNLHDGKNSIKQPYTYTGREHDRETGLIYYRARYYDPQIGRFLLEDPIGFAGGDVNAYGYVGNNPINWLDPQGRSRISFDCFKECWVNCINSNYGRHFYTLVDLSYLSVSTLLQEFYNGAVDIAAKDYIKSSSVDGAMTDGDIVKKIAASEKGEAAAKRLARASKFLSFLSKGSGIIGAGATGFVVGASAHCSACCL